jgi:hypothetical protein
MMKAHHEHGIGTAAPNERESPGPDRIVVEPTRAQHLYDGVRFDGISHADRREAGFAISGYPDVIAPRQG